MWRALRLPDWRRCDVAFWSTRSHRLLVFAREAIDSSRTGTTGRRHWATKRSSMHTALSYDEVRLADCRIDLLGIWREITSIRYTYVFARVADGVLGRFGHFSLLYGRQFFEHCSWVNKVEIDVQDSYNQTFFENNYYDKSLSWNLLHRLTDIHSVKYKRFKSIIRRQ